MPEEKKIGQLIPLDTELNLRHGINEAFSSCFTLKVCSERRKKILRVDLKITAWWRELKKGS
jgi:hypothetical protein